MNGSIPDVDASQVLTPHIWPTDSVVQLLNVPWDSAYRDVVAWESAESRDAWFEDNKSSSWFQTNFQNIRPGEPVSVPVPYSSVYKYNYIMVTNPKQPVEYEGPARSYFYFITSVEYLSAQATRLTVQLDVMTTYAGHIELGRAYVDRGHIAMANETVSDANLTLTLANLGRVLDLPESVDTGDTLVPAARTFIPFNTDGNGIVVDPYIVVMCTANLQSDPGTVSNPNLDTASGDSITDKLPSACGVYIMDMDTYRNLMYQSTKYSWVSQCIICIYALPKKFIKSLGAAVTLLGGKVTGKAYQGFTTVKKAQDFASVVDLYALIGNSLGDEKDVKKLYTYPYAVIELTDFMGNPIYLKPQYVDGNRLDFSMMGCGLEPFSKFAIFPYNYGGIEDSSVKINETYAHGDFLDSAVWFTDLPQFSLVNNNYYTTLASTAHTRAYNYQSAGWQQTRGNMLAAAQYNDTVQGAAATRANANDIGNQQIANANRSNQAAQVNAAIGFGAGAINAGISTVQIGRNANLNYQLGTPTPYNYGPAQSVLSSGASAVQSVISSQTQTDNATAMANTQMANAQRTFGVTQGNAQRDYNTAIAVNGGDYQNAIAGINAQVQDTALTPPSTIGQAGGNGFNLSNGLWGMMLTIKVMGRGYRRAVADYFRRYGYSVRRFLALGTPRHMLCMTKFAYWKVLETNLTCATANESEKETIRGIFEKGTTLWDSPESIGMTDLKSNKPKDGYSYL